VHVVRTLLALGVIPLGLLVGLVSLLLTRERRRAVNRVLGLWGRLGPRAAGIRLAVEGAENLERPRPAVFVINHQSGVDAMLVCALLRRDFVAVAKREIRSNPLLGPAFSFAGVVFVDRSDTAEAIRNLAPALAALRDGVSLAIAPEGTRSPGRELGAFRKGAFRIAQAAGVPVVPIVLCNSGDVLPRGARVMRPARVRVVVEPPSLIAPGAAADLERQIAAIRQRYREILAAGPAPG
jgi:putative phosphoserine phosphatase/1-acylglycerol-3-phosphate O-acyltransferase